jgi:hypothetical protein
MFAFFSGKSFLGFWSNRPGDIFFDLTCLKKQWPKQVTSLVYYPGLGANEIQNALPTLDECKVRTKINAEYSEGGELVSPESFTVIKTIPSDKFVINGLMMIPC